MDFVKYGISVLKTNPIGLMGFGLLIGMGFEFFKINFSMRGVSYYKIFNKKQLKNELDAYEEQLKKLNKSASKVSFFSNSCPD